MLSHATRVDASEVPTNRAEICAPMTLRRLRGMLLRLVRRRGVATAVGLALVLPSAWIEFSSQYSTWWIDGLALVGGATGLAILWTGITGPAPDWVDRD
jgi:hypothetical protein